MLGNGVYVSALRPRHAGSWRRRQAQSRKSPANRLRRRCLCCSGPWESELGAAAAFWRGRGRASATDLQWLNESASKAPLLLSPDHTPMHKEHNPSDARSWKLSLQQHGMLQPAQGIGKKIQRIEFLQYVLTGWCVFCQKYSYMISDLHNFATHLGKTKTQKSSYIMSFAKDTPALVSDLTQNRRVCLFPWLIRPYKILIYPLSLPSCHLVSFYFPPPVLCFNYTGPLASLQFLQQSCSHLRAFSLKHIRSLASHIYILPLNICANVPISDFLNH